MNSSSVWLRENNNSSSSNNNKQQLLPTPVILPDTFVEHKKTLLNSPCDVLSSTPSSTLDNNSSNHKKIRLPSNGSTIIATTTGDKIYHRNYTFSPLQRSLSSSSSPSTSIIQSNDRSPSNCTHCLLHPPPSAAAATATNNFSGSSLNTPVTLRSMSYKRFKDFNYSTGPINLSKNELNTSLYDSKKNLRFIDQCFNINCVLDKGTFSEVYHAQSKIDGQYYAIKAVNLIQKHYFMFKYNEVKILDHILLHSNVIHFYSAWREYDYMFIKTELCLDNFSNLLVIKRIDEIELLIFLAHSLSGLEHIHSFNIVHMDIKSSNILLGLDGYYKVADFGLATFLSKRDSKNGVTEGDSRYMALELLNNQVSPAVDIFSLGMSLVEAIFNINLPVDGSLWHRLRQGYLPSHDFESTDYSTQLYNYTKQMIALDPILRPSPPDLFQWDELRNNLNRKSTYLDMLKPQYEACVITKINSSDSLCSLNHSYNNTNDNILTCSTPVIFLPSTKKSPLDSNVYCQSNNSDDDGNSDDGNSDVIELNFSD